MWEPAPMSATPSAWHVVRRLQSYRGEERANVVRIGAIACFYAIELINRHGLNLGFIELERVSGVDDRFHAAMTALTAAWIIAAMGVVVLMRNQRFPPALKYVVTSVDVFLLTMMLMVADGPSSPLVVVYFLILAGSPLRFSLAHVRFATVAVVLGYVVTLGDAWMRRPTLRVPRYEQIMMVMAFVITGIALTELVRAVRDMAEGYAARRESLPPAETEEDAS